MYNELKVLYEDKSGNLDLGGNIGKCYIYVFNDGTIKNPYFWVISKNKNIVIEYPLKDLCFRRYCQLTREEQKKIYDYIKPIWPNMLQRRGIYDYNKYSLPKFVTKNNPFKIYNNKKLDFSLNNTGISEFGQDIIDLGERLGSCRITVNNSLKDNPLLVIHSNDKSFYGIYSFLNSNHLMFDKLNREELKCIYTYMCDTHDNVCSNWLMFIKGFIFEDKIENMDSNLDLVSWMDKEIGTCTQLIPRFDLARNTKYYSFTEWKREIKKQKMKGIKGNKDDIR